RQSIVSSSYRAHQRSNGSESCGCALPYPAINNRLSVSIHGKSLRSHLFVETCVEQNDFAGDFFAAQRREMIEAVGHDHFGSKSFGCGGYASTKSRQHNLL